MCLWLEPQTALLDVRVSMRTDLPTVRDAVWQWRRGLALLIRSLAACEGAERTGCVTTFLHRYRFLSLTAGAAAAT